jgi:LysR family transcriptional regulator, low CO2-responsive transcriptional regulator
MRIVTTWDADPDLLRTFVAVRRHGNLTRAAEDLFLSQPAVSRRIARLERSLGLPLFERLGKSLHLTEAGEALAREADVLIGSVDRLAETIRSRRAGELGRLRIGASTTPGLYLLPRVLVRFRRRRPGVEVRYAIENSLHIEEKIVRNELDVGFVGAHLTHAALRIRPVLQDEVVCYAAKTHALAKRRSVAPKELERETCVVREPGSATRRMVDAWLRRSRVRLSQTIEVGCPEAAKVLVRDGVGFSYLSAFGLRGDGGAGLAPLRVAGLVLRRPIFLVHHADKAITPVLQSFVAEAEQALRAPDDRLDG